jgi:hypothetical protein
MNSTENKLIVSNCAILTANSLKNTKEQGHLYRTLDTLLNDRWEDQVKDDIQNTAEKTEKVSL